jgi:integrase
MFSQKKLAKLPVLYNFKNDLSKKWFVEYAYKNPFTNKLQRFRVSGNINKFSDVQARSIAASELILEYSRKLKNGWNPFLNDGFVYDHLAYSQISKKRKIDFTIEQFLNEVFNQIEVGLRPKTLSKYKGQIRTFCYWLQESKLHKIECKEFLTSHCESFLRKFESSTTRNDYRKNMKMFWERLIINGRADKNPWKTVKKATERRQGLKPFNKFQIEQLKTIFTKENPQLLLFCMFQYYCFVRPGELRLLKIENLDFDNCTVQIPANIAKNKKQESVWLPDHFIPTLKQWKLDYQNPSFYIFGKNGMPGPKYLPVNYFSNKHREILRRLNFSTDFALYSWKHTGAKALATKTGNVKELQMQLRHHDLNTTDIYLKSLGIMEFSGIKTNFPAL